MTEVNNRPVFKMNNDFWNQARGPPQMMAQNLSNSNQNSPVPGSANSIPAHSPSQHSTSSQNQNHVMAQNQMAMQQQNQNQLQQPQQSNTPNSHPQTPQNPQNAQQMTPNSQMSQQSNNHQQQQQPQNNGQNQQHTPQMGSPNTQHHNLQAAHAHALAQQHLAQMTQHHLGSGQNSPEKLHEKLVNDIQLLSQLTLPDMSLQRNTSSSSISERTLEECWTTLQRIFMTKSMHMHARELTGRSEVKPHQCQQCLKSFSSNHQLVQHIRVHTGEKPYKCSYCDRRFKQLSHVQQHTRLHTGERPYKCHLPDCGRAFIQLSNLQQHLRNHDAQVERAKNRPFHCNICGKGFATESSLRTHTSKVSHCIGRLQQHAALIGGPNATTCPLCHKMFIGGESLMEHMKHTHKDPNASGVASLLSHMEHMRMDPKHQFAAQYVLSRAAAERRERETLLAAVSASASGSGLLPLPPIPGQTGGSPMCASPSAHSDSSSGNGRLSSTGSDAGGLNNNNNNCNTKLGDILRSNNGLHQQYNVEEQLHNANRMAALANMVSQGGVPPGLGSDPASNIANIANLMRLGVTQANQVNNSNPSTPPINNDALNAVNASVNAMNAMRASMESIRNMDPMRSSVMDSQQSQQQEALRMQQHAEALLRSQAEAALRLAMSQALPQLNQQDNNNPLRHNGNYQSHQGQPSQQLSPDLTEALRLQEQRLEQALRLHGSDPRSLGFSLSGQQQNQNQP
ncbi:uncharacterized protein LOC123674906 isoform X9 [Harmonia axyridis]|uniref:uncharacterized protein LOC123674906 isoform X9 n=1 Tax=Harmonia axyridis TaxID=115357 RepID=UPI001E277E08|nr:uncharacterized protein LOC123674906 isoform X9 [Harmonia axyridis]